MSKVWYSYYICDRFTLLCIYFIVIFNCYNLFVKWSDIQYVFIYINVDNDTYV